MPPRKEDGEVESLNVHRAEKSGDGKDWKPIEALRSCIEDMEEEGIEPDGMLLVLHKSKGDGSCVVLHYTAGISAPEGVWLAKIAADRLTHGM